jgi:hypothetical protein
VSVLLVLLARFFGPKVWKTAVSILLAAGAVIGPWTIRNLISFKQFVPVRNGLGQNIHLGNPILAETFYPKFQACSNQAGPAWTARDAAEAIMLARKIPDKRSALYKRAFECIEQDALENYEKFNEAERDGVYLKNAISFVFSELETFATMTYHKSVACFYAGWTKEIRAVALLAFIGALITLRNQKARILTLLTLLYAIAYSLAVPLFYRYRYPIEPILLVLSSHVCIVVLCVFSELVQRGVRRLKDCPAF